MDDLGGHVCEEMWVNVREVLVVNLVEAFGAKVLEFLLTLVLQEILLIHDLFQGLLFDVLRLIGFDGESGSVERLSAEVLDRLLGGAKALERDQRKCPLLMNSFHSAEPTKKLLKVLLLEILWIILDINSEFLGFTLPLDPLVVPLLLSLLLALIELDIEQLVTFLVRPLIDI